MKEMACSKDEEMVRMRHVVVSDRGMSENSVSGMLALQIKS
jgi:hypothetical protein